MSGRSGADPDRLATLEEERAFLLRSLADLEREHDAGDVDVDDYATLRDDYTARAADVLRSIDAGRAALPAKPPRDTRRIVRNSILVLAIGALVFALLTRSTSDRRAGQTITGGIPGDDVNSLLVEARALQLSDPLGAIQRYEAVIELEPDNVEALTYRGWTAAFVALGLPDGPDRDVLAESAATFLDLAREADPTYPDAQCFTAIVRFRFFDDAEGAAEPLERCREGDLPASVAGLIDALGTQVDEALGQVTTTTP